MLYPCSGWTLVILPISRILIDSADYDPLRFTVVRETQTANWLENNHVSVPKEPELNLALKVPAVVPIYVKSGVLFRPYVVVDSV